MKILLLHCDYIKWRPLKKAIKTIEELSDKDKKEHEIKECLVVMSAVEKIDENVHEVSQKVFENILDVANQVKTKKIVLYPYAHLSKDLASPEIAQKVLDEAEKKLKKEFEVYRAPFGYYKELEFKVKGHPLSELSREIRVDSLKGNEEEVDLKYLQERLTKIKMSAPKGKNGLKSNVELGRDLDLYIVSEVVGGGLPLFTPKGATIKREIERFVIDEELKRGYLHTSTPIMAKSDLYKISGHWQHYREGMFVMDVGKEKFALRPMTCPFQFVLYKSKPRSYKELPMKYAEIATLFRNEQSGELRGLTRLRQFTLADAHVICTPEQIENEFIEVLELINFVMDKMGINDTWFRFSKWDPKNKEKYVDNPSEWDRSQKLMKKILDKMKLKYVEADNEAAFYGPKLDLQYRDVYGKEDTMFTVQIDFALPEKFDMCYKDKDNQEKQVMIIHRSSSGCTERAIGHILELTQGNLKLWMNPNQVKVLTMTDRNNKYGEKLMNELSKNDIRVEINNDGLSISKKVRDAQVEKFNYMVIAGDKEEKSNTISIRERDGKIEYDVKLSDFISKLKKEIEGRI